MDATPETQIPVVCRALIAHGFIASHGRKKNANQVTIRGAKAEDRSIVFAISREYAKGFDIDVRLVQTYWIVSLFLKGKNAQGKSEDLPTKIVDMDGY
jgi:hypothetical protein